MQKSGNLIDIDFPISVRIKKSGVRKENARSILKSNNTGSCSKRNFEASSPLSSADIFQTELPSFCENDEDTFGNIPAVGPAFTAAVPGFFHSY